MSFDFVEYLNLAKTLARSPDEASRRSAISRAYYAVYIAARRRLEDNGVQIQGEVHRAVWTAYMSKSPRGRGLDHCGRIAQGANELRNRRVKADYEDNYPGLEAAVREQIDTATKLFTQIRELRQDKLPTQADVNARH